MVESLFVGIYTYFIYLLLCPLFKNLNILLLVCGFIKHFFGYILGIWTMYCKICKGDLFKASISCSKLIGESILEGILFLIVGNILTKVINNKSLLFIVIGVVLHFLFELLGMHVYFCETKCNKVQ